MLTDRQDHKLLKEAISEHELLGGTRDVTVVVKDSHTCETSDLNLECHMGAEVDIDLSLAGGVGTAVCSSCEGSSENLVSNLINHCCNIKTLLIII